MTDLRICRAGGAEAIVAASPGQVWALLTDVTRVGEWSHECQRAAWLGEGPPAAVVGARFRGPNRAGLVRWGRRCEVTVADPPRRFAYRTDGGWAGDRTEWTFELHPAGAGTRIVQSYRVLAMPRWAEVVVRLLLPAHADRRAALTADLERLGAVADGVLPS